MRRLLALFFLLTPTLAVGSPAGAQEDGPTRTEWQDPTLVITATAPGTPALTDTPGAPSDGPRYYCGWFSLDITSTDIAARLVSDPTVGDTYVFNCWSTQPWVDPYPGYPVVAVFDPVVDPPGPLITAPEVARFAVDSIDFAPPSVVTSPAGVQVIGVPSWFAVDSALDYAPASAQAGPVWATVRPVFREVEWAFADGERLVCATDATTVWRIENDHSTCRHTFTSLPASAPSASGPGSGPVTMPTSATVRWTVWERTDRTAGAWRQWGVIGLTTTFDLPIVDLQAVID